MRHGGTRQLDNGDLPLRRFTRNDAGAMFRNRASGREVTKYLTRRPHENSGVTEKILENRVESYSENPFHLRAITLREESAEPIGSIAVVGRSDEPATVYTINIGVAASPQKPCKPQSSTSQCNAEARRNHALRHGNEKMRHESGRLQ